MVKKKEVIKYTKAELLQSNSFDVDILAAALEENKTYSLYEVKKVVDNFMKKKVNNEVK